VSSSRCSSDGRGGTSTPSGWKSEGFFRRLPSILQGILVGLLLAALISSWQSRRAVRQRPRPDEPARVWFPVGTGEVEFLGDVVSFEIVRKAGEEAFRISEPSGAAFENSRLDAVLRTFLREKLAGLRTGESLALRFREPRYPSWRVKVEGAPLSWSVSIEEEKRGEDTWYRSSGGKGGDFLLARTVEELKEKVAREAAREVVVFYSAEPSP